MNPLDYVAHETERQSGTTREALGMYLALEYARSIARVTEPVILDWINAINGQTWYRYTPVYFRNGGTAASSGTIPLLMRNLIESLDDLTPDEAVKEFLDIHPFTDGNGRVGSLLWNLLNGSIMDPEPMPYFYGENSG